MMGPMPRVRLLVVLMAVVINMVCYTDRVCIAVAGPELRKAFDLSQAQMGLVFSIFSLSYFLGQTPWGIAADRYGSRSLVSLAVAGWSAFTILTAYAWSFASLMSIRFTFGALEAALSPVGCLCLQSLDSVLGTIHRLRRVPGRRTFGWSYHAPYRRPDPAALWLACTIRGALGCSVCSAVSPGSTGSAIDLRSTRPSHRSNCSGFAREYQR